MPRTLRRQYPGAVYQSCEWSSLVEYTQGKGPDWLVMDRLLNAFELVKVGLPTLQKSLSKLPKGDMRKVQIAVFIKDSTSVSNLRIAERLQMRHTGALSRLMGRLKDRKAMKEVQQLKKMLK